MELVYTADLKSAAFGLAGSSPALATKLVTGEEMTISNREIQKLYDQYNPNKIKSGDHVTVSVGYKYRARVVGLELDIKNKKVFANLKLLENKKNYPIRVDVADCHPSSPILFPGHHSNG